MAEPYHYTPFPDLTSIRLLYIEPKLNDEKLEKCTLRVVSLEDVPPFESLSYTWGQPSPAYIIFIDGKKLTIGINLFQALRGVQQESEVRVIWADAVCINQQDINERTQQVQLMGTIYNKATEVLIWLGIESDDILPAMHLIMKMFQLAMSDHQRGGSARLEEQRLPSSDMVTEWGLPPFSAPEWQSVVRLFLRPWFTRVWIVQEVRAAKSALVLCGKVEMSWMIMFIASSWFKANNVKLSLESDKSGDALMSSLAGVIQLPNRIGCHRLNSDAIERVSLSRVLRQMRAHMATDARDKIFALVNLSVEAESQDQRLIPNYSKSLAHTYRDVSRFLIAAGSLDILSAVCWVPDPRSTLTWEQTETTSEHGILTKNALIWGPPDESLIFPSWVPHWDCPNIAFPLSTCPEDKRYYHASGELAMDLIETEDEDALVLRGLIFDNVQYQSEIKQHTGTHNVPLSDVEYIEWRDLALRANIYPSDARVFAFNATLTAGLTLNYTPICDDTQHLANIRAFEMTLTNVSYNTVNSVPLSDPEPATEVGDSSAFTQLMYLRCSDRRIFVTNKGYMGIGPEGMLPGDKVCILFGGLTPYILRKKGLCWQFVGECYVHGIMHGEAVIGIQDSSAGIEVFEIR